MIPGPLLPAAGNATAARTARPGTAVLASKSELEGKPVKGRKTAMSGMPGTPTAQDFASALARHAPPIVPAEGPRHAGKAKGSAADDDKDPATPATLDLAALGLSPLPAAGAAQTANAPAPRDPEQAIAAAPAPTQGPGPALAPQPGAQPKPAEPPLPVADGLPAPLTADSASAPTPGKPAARTDKGQAVAAPSSTASTLQAESPVREDSSAGLNGKPPLASPERESPPEQGPAAAQPPAPGGAPPGSPALGLASAWVSSPPAPPAAASPSPPVLHHALLPQAPGSAAWQQALGQQLVFMSQSGLHSAQLQLHPLELGPLQVNLQMVDGELRAHFKAEQASVREVVEAALPQLRSALGEQGLSLGQAQVGAGSSHAEDRRENATPGGQGLGLGLGRKHLEAGPTSASLARSLGSAASAGPGRLHTWA